MISVFYKKSKILNQQNLVKLDKPVKAGRKNKSIVGGLKPSTSSTGMKDENRLSYFTGYQRSILEIDNWAEHGTSRKYQHPTQKPVDLIRYLIRTYTNPGDIILDNCMGSGTTAIAAMREKRHFIGFELDKNFYDICQQRIADEANYVEQEKQESNPDNSLF